MADYYKSIQGQQPSLNYKLNPEYDELPPEMQRKLGPVTNTTAAPAPSPEPGILDGVRGYLKDYFNPEARIPQRTGETVVDTPEMQRAVVDPQTGETDTEVPQTGAAAAPMALTMPQYRTTKAEWVPGQRTIQEGMKLDDAAGKLINRGQEQQLSAAELQTLTEIEKAKETHAISEQRASLEQERAAEVRTRAAEVQAKTAEKMNHINALASEVENGKVDPSHYFTSQSTGAKLATMLSVVLGAGAAQRINGRNVGLDMMNDAVARDIDAQKAAIDSKRAGLSAQQNIYGQMLHTFGREDAAKEAAHIVGLTAIKAKLDAQIAKYGASDAANKGLAVSGQLAEQIGAKKQDLANMTSDRTTRTEVFRPEQTVQVGGFSGGAGGPGTKESKEQNELFVPELGGYARSTKEGAELRAQTGSGRFVIDQLAEMKKMARDVGTSDKLASAVGYDTDAMDRLNAQAEDLVQPLVALYGGGAAAEYEAKSAVKRMVGSMRLGKDPAKSISEQYRRVSQKMESLKKTAGIREAKEGFGLSQKGDVVQHGTMTGRMAADVPQEKPVAVQPIKAGK